ncbi:carbon-nitrogen hydrolase family protein [Kineosporia sp. R_H_3]|uniref:carbon-nitrogen hydrolase family protein n=1 Tax=Kineosporia sp. R_H_3 TaxID=1961848 RepID=UPI00117A7A96|nr:carbon-nitrogen hydrolase family protein [Kineosporia sp. R_H_3]
MSTTRNVKLLLPLIGWCAVLPLALLALLRTPLEAGLAAALVGGLASAAGVWSRTLRHLVPLTAATSAVSWGAAVALAAWLVPGPWLVVGLPAAVVAALLPLRLLGAPRFANNPLARTQQPWLVVVHTARLGGDLMTTAVLATASTAVALALCGYPWAATAGGVFVVTVLAFGWVSFSRATAQVERGVPRRVAAVVVDGRPPEHGELTGTWPAESPEYRDVEGTLARYRPHVEDAARQGAEVIVLPEVSFVADDAAAAERWCGGVEEWARALDVTIVAPYFDMATPRNTLAVIDKTGVVAHHDKQHPARGAEPPCLRKMEVGPHRLADGTALSTAICVDLDYSDTARSARRAHALLAAPSNDWPGGFEVLHHRSAVWAAVMGGVPVVRATGQGISSVYDAAGHVLEQRRSAGGPVVLVADVRG